MLNVCQGLDGAQLVGRGRHLLQLLRAGDVAEPVAQEDQEGNGHDNIQEVVSLQRLHTSISSVTTPGRWLRGISHVRLNVRKQLQMHTAAVSCATRDRTPALAC